ncbi:MAG: hypothetical protein HY296_01290 [Thaumarchaeota archaeon]|nr:hypothetical protein [Nitrososphaerota archaeon]
MLGTVLAITPSLAVAGTTTYDNKSGENATVNVTDNQDAASFTVTAAGACTGDTLSTCNTIPFLTETQIALITEYQYHVGGFKISSPNTQTPDFPCIGLAYGCSPTQEYGIPGSTVLQYGTSGPETLMQFLQSLHSYYMFTGIGDTDTVTLHGGMTNDIFSITTPGSSSAITVTAGLGNSTYNLILGDTGTLTIDASHSNAAFNYYNVIYEYPH